MDTCIIKKILEYAQVLVLMVSLGFLYIEGHSSMDGLMDLESQIVENCVYSLSKL